MTRIQRLMKLHRLQGPAGEGGSDTGGTGSGDGQGGGEGGEGGQGAGEGEGEGEGSEGGKGAGQGGKPSDSEAKLLKDVMKHKTRAGELETQLTQVNERLKAFEGIDANAVRAMLKEKEEIERKKLEEKGEYDRLVKQMGERHGTEKSELLQKIEESVRAAQALQQQIAELTVGNAFNSSTFVRDDLTLTPTKARVIYGAHFEFKDGKVVGYDKPAGAADRTMLVSSTSEPLGFETALLKIIEADPDKDHLLRSKMKSGAGSSTATKGAKKDQPNTKNLTSVERIANGLKALANQK